MVKTLTRLINALLDGVNRYNKRKAANSAADTIANGGRVRDAEQSFSDLAEQSGSDKPERRRDMPES